MHRKLPRSAPVAARAITLVLGAYTTCGIYYCSLENELATNSERNVEVCFPPSRLWNSWYVSYQVSVGPPVLASASDDNKSEPRIEIFILGGCDYLVSS